MSSTDHISENVPLRPEIRLAIWPVFIGFLVLYVPTYLSLVNGAWTGDRNAHGPLILILVLIAVYRSRERIRELPIQPGTMTGSILLVLGLAMYVFGRSQDIRALEVSSQIPVICGLLLCMGSVRAVRELWFPLVFLVFLIPLPGVIVDYVTLPLKNYVSVIVDQILYLAGYPVARSGVVITIGPYQMLIADACSGLNSMYSLTALGIVYIYLRGHARAVQNIVLLVAVVPIAFMANVARVTALVLITFYFGDSAGQGFLHDFAGGAEFVIALLLLLTLDGLLATVVHRVLY